MGGQLFSASGDIYTWKKSCTHKAGGKFMDTSTQIEQLKRKLVGLWDVELSRTMPDRRKVTGTGILLAKETAMGHAISAEYGLTVPGAEPYEEAEFWWFDRQNKKFHLFCVNSREESRDQAGTWKNEDTLVLEWKGEREGEDSSFVLTFTWISLDEIHVLKVDTVQGRKGPVSVFKLRRKKEIASV
jgi:hypothetical protein